MGTEVTIIKRNHRGEDQLSYEGELVTRAENWVCIEARFGFSDRNLGYVHLRKGDYFTEWFYNDRWYNIFRVRDVDSGELKGFYCNFTRPADLGEQVIAADDLELDLFVKPDGSTLLLDEEDYAALELTIEERAAVGSAVAELQRLVAARAYPFHNLPASQGRL